MKPTPRQLVITVTALALAPLADAHPLTAHGDVLAAFLHPFTGFDHLLAMVIVGLWAGAARTRQRAWPPLAFLVGLAGGALLGGSAAPLPGAETAVAVSLLLLGPLAARARRVPPVASVVLCLLAGLVHGEVHGIELAPLGATAWAFVLGSVTLHGLGFALARIAAARRATGPLRAALDASALTGLWMLGALG